MRKEQISYVSFKITGEGMTRSVRDIALSNRWRHALTTVCDGLIGISMEQAMSILDGSHKLIGDSSIGMDLVPDNPTDEETARYIRDMNYQYGCCWSPDGGDAIYKPYAIVTSFGMEDLSGPVVLQGESSSHRLPNDGFAGRDYQPTDWRSGKNPWLRVMYYADDPWNDKAFVVKYKGTDVSMLFKRVMDSLPIWMKPYKKPQEAVFAAEEHGIIIKERGHRVSFPEPTKIDDEDEPIAKKAFQRLTSTKPKSDSITSLYEDLLPESMKGVAADMAKAMSGEQDWDSEPKKSDHKDFASGYILRDGSFYGCGYMEHPALGTRILKHIFDCEVDDPEKEMDNKGAVRLQKSATGESIQVMCEKKPTKKQITAIFDHSVAHHGILGQYDYFMDNGGWCDIKCM